MSLVSAVELILYDIVSVHRIVDIGRILHKQGREEGPLSATSTHIKIIRLPHLQASIPTEGARSIAVAHYSFETMATAPLSSVASRVTLHAVMC